MIFVLRHKIKKKLFTIIQLDKFMNINIWMFFLTSKSFLKPFKSIEGRKLGLTEKKISIGKI